MDEEIPIERWRMPEIVKKVPIPAAGVALGLAALGNLLQPLSPAARMLCGALSLFMVALVIAKAVRYPAMIRDDFRNPILASVSATLLMALMQLSGYLAPYAAGAAFALWGTAVAAHLALMGWFTWRFIRNFKLDQVFPTYFICYVGIIVASVTSPLYGMEAIGQVLFWLGFACYPPLLATITYRYIKHPVPDAARPLFCIYSAPASLSLVGYLAITPEPSIAFASVLLIAGQLFFVIVALRLPRFIAGGFFPSFAAMTFPFVITATAFTQALDLFAGAGMAVPASAAWAAAAETAFAACMVAFVLSRYLVFLFKPAAKPQPVAAEEGQLDLETA